MLTILMLTQACGAGRAQFTNYAIVVRFCASCMKTKYGFPLSLYTERFADVVPKHQEGNYLGQGT